MSGKSRFDLSEYIKLTEQYSFIKFEFGFGFEIRNSFIRNLLHLNSLELLTESESTQLTHPTILKRQPRAVASTYSHT